MSLNRISRKANSEIVSSNVSVFIMARGLAFVLVLFIFIQVIYLIFQKMQLIGAQKSYIHDSPFWRYFSTIFWKI